MSRTEASCSLPSGAVPLAVDGHGRCRRPGSLGSVRHPGLAVGDRRKTSDPEGVLHTLLERDRMFTQLLGEEAKRLALPAIEINTTMTEDDLTERVTETFGL
jgi:hypothetical protein